MRQRIAEEVDAACRELRREYMIDYYADDPARRQRQLQHQRNYRAKNIEKVRAYDREYMRKRRAARQRRKDA